MLKHIKSLALALAITALSGVAGAQVAGGAFQVNPGEDNHAGYYYPELTSNEIYGARATPLPDASRGSRIGFVTGLTQQQLAKAYAPNFAMFAKGNNADKMIIVSLGDHGFRSLYQARGLLAQLTAVARATTIFREMQVEDAFTFFDLARMLGFTQITVTDGETFAHQVLLQ